MAKFPPDDDADSGSSPERRDLTDEEVADAFLGIAHNYLQDSLPGPRDYVAAEDREEFVPPDPGPVSSSDPFLNLGWALLAGGLLTIIATMVLWPSAPKGFHIACVAAAVLGGFILTWRMPRERHDDGDHGAVV